MQGCIGLGVSVSSGAVGKSEYCAARMALRVSSELRSCRTCRRQSEVDMVCYKPRVAYRSYDELTVNGKPKICFSSMSLDSYHAMGREGPIADRYLLLPCGQCIGCRLEHSRQWAVRIMHEAESWSENCFVTLTYDDAHLPSDNSLHVEEFQKFMKRFRKRKWLEYGLNRSGGIDAVAKSDRMQYPIRFYHCGEYGELFARPHYHACIFNFDFFDKELYTVRDGIRLYTSQVLSELWPFGFATVGSLTFESAAYVARYCTKKVTGDVAEEHYQGRVPEYATMSRRPGIGRDWIDKYKGVTYRDDSVIMRGVGMKPPRYYDTIFQLEQPELFEKVQASRVERGFRRAYDSTTHRLGVREFIKKRQFKQLIRSFEGV